MHVSLSVCVRGHTHVGARGQPRYYVSAAALVLTLSFVGLREGLSLGPGAR